MRGPIASDRPSNTRVIYLTVRSSAQLCNFFLSSSNKTVRGREEQDMSERTAVRSGGGQCRRVSDGDERRYWNELNPEVLALIFKRLPPDELARTMSFVCRGWRDVVAGTYCWSEIDVEEWCRRVNRVDDIDVGVVKLVALSRGSVRRLSAYRIGNWGFSFTAVS
ncbi:hypothetical protein KSP40_PGU008403 [Platanthera guangdongensis]|uniref:F-box domain-containing protein n=1 Tax=Platanthera guangdongensis TaxID=2320717 RepID=A0ABR2LPF0_9ASPA